MLTDEQLKVLAELEQDGVPQTADRQVARYEHGKSSTTALKDLMKVEKSVRMSLAMDSLTFAGKAKAVYKNLVSRGDSSFPGMNEILGAEIGRLDEKTSQLESIVDYMEANKKKLDEFHLGIYTEIRKLEAEKKSAYAKKEKYIAILKTLEEGATYSSTESIRIREARHKATIMLQEANAQWVRAGAKKDMKDKQISQMQAMGNCIYTLVVNGQLTGDYARTTIESLEKIRDNYGSLPEKIRAELNIEDRLQKIASVISKYARVFGDLYSHESSKMQSRLGPATAEEITHYQQAMD